MDEVAGYRVLRSAGHGSRSRLLLGHDEGSTVVLKVCAAGDPRVGVELAALDRAAGHHVVALLDVAADEHGTVLVLERLPGGSLDDLLDRRSGLEAGEAVTILAPLATTLERLHAAGVAHGSLSLGSVVFRDDGAPTLVGFGAAELFARGAPEIVRETVPGVLADRSALRALVSLVLGCVTGDRAAAARRLAEALGDATPAHVAEALYGVAAPTAIVFDEQSSPPAADWGGAPVGEEAAASRAPVLPPWLLAFLPDGLRDRVSAGIDRLRVSWEGWPVGRRRLGLGFGAATLTVVVALAIVPSSPSTVAVDPPGAGTVGAETGDADPGDAEPGESADGLPDDPVDAAVLLLARREECLRELSVLCLDDVVQAGSAAQADDVALVRAVSGGAEYPAATVVEGDPVLVERLGDSALLDLPPGSEPGSLLLLRTAEGWRIRQYVESTYLEAPAFETGTG